MAVFFSVQILSYLSKCNLREMKFIPIKLVLFALATVVFQTSNTMCLDELMKSSLQSTEDDDDKYYKVRPVLL